MSPTPYRFDHVHLRSRDAIAAARFYVDMFEAREVSREGSPTVNRVVVDLCGLTIFIEQAPHETPLTAEAPHLGIEHVGLRVEDIEAARAELQTRGVRFVSDILVRNPRLRVTFLEGPDDALIELLQRT